MVMTADEKGRHDLPLAEPEDGFVRSDPSKFRLHLLGLAHTVTSREFDSCAYTQKIFKMGQMMTGRGHTIFHYGAEGSTLPCTEHITCITTAEQEYAYGDAGWRESYTSLGKPDDYAYSVFNPRAIEEIRKRMEPNDMLLVSMGTWQKGIADAVGLKAIEMGIGYTGVWAPYRVFESYAWMHYLWGMHNKNPGGGDGHNYEVVIPNYFDPADFPFRRKKEDFILYVGRIIGRKGIHIAQQAADLADCRLVVAGMGDFAALGIESSKIDHVGFIDNATKVDLMGRAKALIVPSVYVEPFGGVAVEAMLCGTPVITADWGGFSETVQHGVTGYRCRTMGDYVWAINHAGDLKPADCHRWAERNYSLERVAKMYEEFYEKVDDLARGGYYEVHPERENLDWLRRYH